MEATTNSKVGKQRKLLRVVNMVGNTPVVEPTVNRNEDYVACGRQNLFREFLRALADNVAPLNSCINTMALYIAGKRIVFRDKDGDEVDKATEKWLELTMEDGEAAFRSRIAKDLALLGDRCFEVSLNELRQPAAVYHLDAMRLRSGKKDAKGKVKEFYWCSNWELHTKYKGDYPKVALQAFDIKNMDLAKTGVAFARDYHQGQDYYGMPWYLPALTDAEVWARIPVFNRTQLDTGFRPAFHIHVFTNKDEEDIAELDENIEEVFTGPDGKTYALTTGTTEEGAPQITKLERGDHAGELDKMGDRAEMVIYKACGIPPILMGVEVATGLSGKGLALEQSVTQFIRTQVEPRQKFITDDALRLIHMCGITEAVTCEIEQLSLFDTATDPAMKRQTRMCSITVNEERLESGYGRLTKDGLEEAPDGSNLDPKGNMLLIEAGSSITGTNEPTGEPTTGPDNA